MKTKIETINRDFDEQIAACAARSQALLADDRTAIILPVFFYAPSFVQSNDSFASSILR